MSCIFQLLIDKFEFFSKVVIQDVKEIELQLTKELKSISNWLTDNKLALHLGKTESILFGTKKKLQCTSTQLNVTCGGRMLSAKSTVKYLGVELKQHQSISDVRQK